MVERYRFRNDITYGEARDMLAATGIFFDLNCDEFERDEITNNLYNSVTELEMETDIVRKCIADYLHTVSYTHLDVYKRQGRQRGRQTYPSVPQS